MNSEEIWLEHVIAVGKKEMALSTRRLTGLINFAHARGCGVWFPRYDSPKGHGAFDISTFRCVWR